MTITKFYHKSSHLWLRGFPTSGARMHAWLLPTRCISKLGNWRQTGCSIVHRPHRQGACSTLETKEEVEQKVGALLNHCQ